MKIKALTLFALTAVAVAGALLSMPAGAQFEINPAFSQTEAFRRRDNNLPLYYLTGDEVADDAFFNGQRKITSFSFAYRAAFPVRAVIRFYNRSLTAPIDTGDENPGRTIERGPLVREIVVADLPAGDRVQTVSLGESERFVWGTPPDRELAAVLGRETNQTLYGGSGYFSIQFTDAAGGPAGAGAGSLITRATSFRPIPQQLFAEYGSDSVITNVTQSNRTIRETEFYPLTPGAASLDVGLYFEALGANATAAPGPTVTPTPTPKPAPAVSAVTLSAASVRAGTSVTGTVTLNVPAENGAVVSLASSNPAAASVPATVGVPAGAQRVDFTVTVPAGQPNNYVVITASLNGGSRLATLNIKRR